MRKPRPIVYSLNEVTITRDDTTAHITAHIKYKDPDFAETTLEIGPEVAQMAGTSVVQGALDNRWLAEQGVPSIRQQ